MTKVRKKLSSKSKGRTTKAALATTYDDINMLLNLAELYNTNYDFETAEWFWREYSTEKASS
ncbi:MAG TPA: hypothetical protein VIP70_00765 [Nitrososphaeraceae archaeon]